MIALANVFNSLGEGPNYICIGIQSARQLGKATPTDRLPQALQKISYLPEGPLERPRLWYRPHRDLRMQLPVWLHRTILSMMC